MSNTVTDERPVMDDRPGWVPVIDRTAASAPRACPTCQSGALVARGRTLTCAVCGTKVSRG